MDTCSVDKPSSDGAGDSPGPDGPGMPGGTGAEAPAKWTILLHSHDETVELGRAIGERARGGDIFALTGPLGAGKTTLAQGIMAGLGVEGRVTSPTFTLMQRYEGRLEARHIDAYRLNDPAALHDLGVDLDRGEGAVTVVEWADRVLARLPRGRLEIQLEHGADPRAGRKAVVTARGSRARYLLQELKHEYNPHRGGG